MGGCDGGVGGMAVAVGGEVSYGADAVASCIHQGASTKCIVKPNIVVPMYTLWRTEECVDALNCAQLPRVEDVFQADVGGVEAVC